MPVNRAGGGNTQEHKRKPVHTISTTTGTIFNSGQTCLAG